MGESVWQKRKKNNNRVKAKDRPFFSSIQKQQRTVPKAEKPNDTGSLF